MPDIDADVAINSTANSALHYCTHKLARRGYDNGRMCRVCVSVHIHFICGAKCVRVCVCVGKDVRRRALADDNQLRRLIHGYYATFTCVCYAVIAVAHTIEKPTRKKETHIKHYVYDVFAHMCHSPRQLQCK